MIFQRNGRWAYHNTGDFGWYRKRPSRWPYLLAAIAAVLLILTFSRSLTAQSVEQVAQPSVSIQETPITIIQQNSIAINARITGYSTADSCHNKNANGQCLAANGKPVQLGDIACPHWLKLGTQVRYQGKTYTCNDRTADWVQRKWVRTPTFDIFHESCTKGVCGLTKATIEILTN